MTKDEKLEAAKEFSRRVLAEALAETMVLTQQEVLGWAMELGLIQLRKATRNERADFDLEKGAELYDFERWLEPPLTV